jgi:alpha-tubulin suppressor-like RCC1 family protein
MCSKLLTDSCETCRYKVIKAGVGRNHTVVVTDDGKSFSFGHNKHGQLGTGSLRNGWFLLLVAPSVLKLLLLGHQFYFKK